MLGIYDVYKGPDNIVPAIAGAAQFPISDPMCVSYSIPMIVILTQVGFRLQPWPQ